ncbi:MCE family protein [Nonomuraea sp. NN258]|uniref:MCE family protein n=1 Tax=Nonomuraea antri TaxID=2730852 RepID=UPI001567FCE4|nr:MCE family protein [Nonomuraea antri]NRQ39550.1 MCE family protein [Nonomuraea antri]
MRAVKRLRERNPILVGLAGLLIVAGVGAAAYRADELPIIGGGTLYTANFSEAAGLTRGDEVRVAGVKVGKVTDVALDGGQVKVEFRVKDAWIGNRTTGAIMIRTLLGAKYLALDPLGPAPQDPAQTIPATRTIAPYDVTTAFDDLGRTIAKLDTADLAESLDTISATFARTPPHVRTAVQGLSALSRTISSRDDQIAELLAGTRKFSGTLAEQSDNFEELLKSGNLLLEELLKRRQAIHALLTGTRRLSYELVGLVEDNREQLAPTLQALSRVGDVLLRNQRVLDRALSLAGTYTRLVGNTLGNGRWMDGYLCGVMPREYLPDGIPEEGCRPPQPGGRPAPTGSPTPTSSPTATPSPSPSASSTPGDDR